jgi:hypothetical protein
MLNSAAGNVPTSSCAVAGAGVVVSAVSVPCPVGSIRTALGANRRAVDDAGTLGLEVRTALRANQNGRKLSLPASRVRMTPATLRSAVLPGSAQERYAASLTFSEGTGAPLLPTGRAPACVGAEPCRLPCGSEINPTPLAGSRFRRDECSRCLEHLTWHTGHPWTAWAFLRLEITLTDPAFGRSQSGERLLTSLCEIIPNTHTLGLRCEQRTCTVR